MPDIDSGHYATQLRQENTMTTTDPSDCPGLHLAGFARELALCTCSAQRARAEQAEKERDEDRARAGAAELDPACLAHGDALAEVGLTEKNTEKEN